MYVSVHVDPFDVLDQLSDEQLEKALRKRKETVPSYVDETRDLIESALASVKRGDAQEAAFLLERALFPKFESFEKAMAAYATARKGGPACAS